MPDSTIPSNGYLRDIFEQPQAVQATLDALCEAPTLNDLPERLMRGDFRQIVLTGMGSSLHAFHPLQQGLVHRGYAALLVETSELLHYLPGLLQQDTLVIAASQSGRSAEIVQLLAQRSRGFTLLGVSNTPDSPLAREADACVLTRAGEEVTVSCKTYLATLLALAWLEPELHGEPTAERLEVLAQAEPAVKAYLADWQSHQAELEERLKGVRNVFITGRGPSLAAVGTGGLITKEAAHVHAEGMSSAAFRHGPLEMVSPEVFVLVFEGLPSTAELNRRLFADIQAADGQAALVSSEDGLGPFCLPKVPDPVLPLVEILPVQCMTIALANLRGHEPGRFTRATKITTVA